MTSGSIDIALLARAVAEIARSEKKRCTINARMPN
jgi:hypothetical protein